MRLRRLGMVLSFALPWLLTGAQRASADDVPGRYEPILHEPGLYEGRTIVTGQGEENRALGVADCFSDVLAKVSGDLGMLTRPAPAGDAAGAVTRFDYHDRMAGLPLHDEEGTRRRPYDLTVDFDPGKVAAALRALGASPWTGPRPRLVPVVAVSRGGGGFVLASDGDASYGQRDALRDAAWQTGLPVALPDAAAFARDGLSLEAVSGADPARLDAFAKRNGGDMALVGTLSWSDADICWTGRWRLSSAGRLYAWDNRAESFDAAYRGAMRGAAQVLSGHAVADRFTVP